MFGWSNNVWISSQVSIIQSNVKKIISTTGSYNFVMIRSFNLLVQKTAADKQLKIKKVLTLSY